MKGNKIYQKHIKSLVADYQYKDKRGYYNHSSKELEKGNDLKTIKLFQDLYNDAEKLHYNGLRLEVICFIHGINNLRDLMKMSYEELKADFVELNALGSRRMPKELKTHELDNTKPKETV